MAQEKGVPIFFSLDSALKAALERLERSPDERTGAETLIPLEIWRSLHFREWYRAQRAAGHILEDVQNVEWIFRVGPSLYPLYFALHVSIRVSGEGRVKQNEAVIIRPSISTTCIFSRGDTPSSDRFVIVKEYRTGVMNSRGFVYELAGGASFSDKYDAVQVAINEVREETGIEVTRERCRVIGKRQIASTMVANQATLIAVELNNTEMDAIEKTAGSVHGNMAQESERTYLCVMSRKQIEECDAIDWAVKGMISSAVAYA
jgi:hypothetical protein